MAQSSRTYNQRARRLAPGVHPGDVILEVNRTGVKSADDASASFRRVAEQGTALVLVWRNGQEVFLTVTGA